MIKYYLWEISFITEHTIVVRRGRIDAVLPDSEARAVGATKTIDARGRLVTPGLIDVHHHVGYVFPDSVTAGGGAISRFVMRPDSIAAYRARWAKAYLPFGVTTVREVGGEDRYLPLLTAWMQPSPDAPDFISSGGAFVSHEDGRVPYLAHTEVRDPARGTFEQLNVLGDRDPRMTRLIETLARSGATVTPTLHLFAQHVGEAAFKSSLNRRLDSTEMWTPAQRARAHDGFRILGEYVRQLHAAGVQLAVGTDWIDPGLATLSEMIVLHKIGIPMPDVLQIAPLGGARVIERDGEIGAVESGYRANLVMFDVDPIARPDGLFGPKMVIKDGVEWRIE